MAKRKAATRTKSGKAGPKGSATRGSAKRPTARRIVKRSVKQPVKHRARAKKKAPIERARNKAVPVKKTAKPTASAKSTVKVPRLDRARRILDEGETFRQTPPSSLDMDRHGTSARSGRAAMAHTLRDHKGMSSDITAGDADVDVEDAYFTGEGSPGGDNQTPGQDLVDEIGKALGVEYDDNEPLKASDKIVERDTHRWELDPASAEDYKERK